MDTVSDDITVVVLPLAAIDRTGRLRPVDSGWAQAIAASMRERGQFTPVLVQKARPGGLHKLIAGEHRCTAREINAASAEKMAATPLMIDGQPAVLAIIRDVSDIEARLMEIDENLARADLNELDRAIFAGERKRAYEALHPQTRHGKASKKEKVANFATILRFTLSTAQLMKKSERAIQLMLHRDEHLTAETKALLRGTWIAQVGVELDALARLDPEEQARAARVMLREQDAQPNVQAALTEIRGIKLKPKADADAEFSKLVALWAKTGAPARAMFRDYLVKPAGKKAGA